MKSIGIVRNFDKLGRVFIPAEIRHTHGWDKDTPMEMFATEDGLFIKAYKNSVDRKEALEYLNRQLIDDSTKKEDKQAIKTAIDFITKA